MYDKLGELLNETLEFGKVKFVKIQKEDNLDSNDNFNAIKKEEFSTKQNVNDNTTETNNRFIPNTGDKKTKRVIYKKITPEVERAGRLLGIDLTDKDINLRKAYKEKIKYYHPDRYVDNPVMYKIATDKTREIVEAYNILVDFFDY